MFNHYQSGSVWRDTVFPSNTITHALADIQNTQVQPLSKPDPIPAGSRLCLQPSPSSASPFLPSQYQACAALDTHSAFAHI